VVSHYNEEYNLQCHSLSLIIKCNLSIIIVVVEVVVVVVIVAAATAIVFVVDGGGGVKAIKLLKKYSNRNQRLKK